MGGPSRRRAGWGRGGLAIEPDGMRRVVIAAVLATLTLVAGACRDGEGRSGTTTTTGSSGAMAANGVVVHLVDGDTVDVDIDGTRERVRLIGIDTPETKKEGTPVECYGPEASAFTASVLPEGTPVHLERDVEPRDQYGRLLAYVYRAEDGLFVNLALMEGGYAEVLRIEPNTAHAEEFVAAARTAAAAGVGLWGACTG